MDDYAQADLKLNADLFWSPTASIHADPARFLIDLARDFRKVRFIY